ncbi:MAG TPA: class I SAM-dependent methyltransferase [Candidatus Binatia bacterium]|nr:class I SAM-dependent methyltransferase [Candidatus Binatia bacterium]
MSGARSFADYAAALDFRYIQPETPLHPATHSAMLMVLDELGVCFEISNTVLPEDDERTRARLGGLCRIPRMSTFAVGALINRAVAGMPPDRVFVNVGVWHGFTLLAGMAGNPDRVCIGVDNFSEFGGPREAFLARFHALRSPRHRFYDLDYRDYFAHVHSEPIGVYLYDGDHAYQHQLEGLRLAEPYFAPGTRVFIDDTNADDPRRATLDFVAGSRWAWRMIFDRRTAQNGHPTLWNGLMILECLGPRP